MVAEGKGGKITYIKNNKREREREKDGILKNGKPERKRNTLLLNVDTSPSRQGSGKERQKSRNCIDNEGESCR